MSKQAAVYARLSKDPDGNLPSIEGQVKDCRKAAEAQGFTVPDHLVFIDRNLSASKASVRRKGYEALLEALDSDHVRTVFVRETSRLYRRPSELERLIAMVEGRGVRIIALYDGEIDFDKGLLIARVKAAVDAEEVRKLSERTRDGHRRKAESGGWAGGPRPFGYDVVGGKKLGGEPARLVLNTAEAAAIRDVATRVLSGTSLHRITIDWNNAGTLPRGGGRWTPSHVKRVLISPTIAGIRIVGGKTVPGSWDAILEPDVRELLISKLDHGPRRNAPSTVARRFPLTGLVTCSRDGTAMRGEMVNETRWAYRCATSAGGCGRVRISGTDLEQFILDVVDERWEEPTSPPPSTDPTPEEAKLLAELAKANARIEQLAEDYADGSLTAAQVKTATAKLEARREKLSETLADILARRERPEVHWRERFARIDAWEARRKAGALEPHEVAEFHDRVAAYIERVNIAPTKRGTRFSPERVQIVWRKEEAA